MVGQLLNSCKKEILDFFIWIKLFYNDIFKIKVLVVLIALIIMAIGLYIIYKNDYGEEDKPKEKDSD